MYVVKSKVKEYAKEKGFRVSEKFLDELDKTVKVLIDKAIEEAKKEKKKTLLDRHLELE